MIETAELLRFLFFIRHRSSVLGVSDFSAVILRLAAVFYG